ncbi:MAG: response regulator, partial [Gorillibacterium sp.]|nr:response regulator [Gorillibacterium sp.]
MYKVLLVDDEMLDLEGLERLTPWDTFGMEVVSAVNSGFEALDYLQAHPVDILISDIRMPIMSGLDLARKATELYPKLKILFVSGYEDFSYAKQAIQLNAFGYILKPIDDGEVVRVLSHVMKELNEEDQVKKLENDFRKSLLRNHDERMFQWLTGASEGEYDFSLLDEQLSKWKLQHGAYQVGLLELDDVMIKLERLTETEKQAILAKTHQALATGCDDEGLALACRGEGYRWVVILAGDLRLERLKRLLENIQRNTTLTITVGLGGTATSLKDLPQSYQSAKNKLSFKIFCGKNRVITDSDIEAYQLQDVMNLDDILEELFEATSQYDLVRIDDCLELIYRNVKGLGKKMAVYNITLHVIVKLDSYLFRMNENLKSIMGMDTTKLDFLYDFETVNDIQSWLRRRLFEISEMLQLKKLRKNHKLVEGVEDYVVKNLESDLSLKDVAHSFAFSPNYLGHLFKEEKGENFSDYVIRRRLERAAELLINPKLKI